jgi:hypothetical protein
MPAACRPLLGWVRHDGEGAPMSRHLPWFAATLAVSVATTAPALAQQVTDGWRMSVTPYLWVSTVESEVTDKAGGAQAESSASFGDLLDHLKFVAIGKGEVQYKRVGAYADLIYLKLGTDQTVTRPVLGPIERDVTLATTTFTLSGFYRVIENDQLNVDLMAGLRYVKLKIDLDFQGARPGLERDASRSFTEPVIGVRATQRLGERTSITGYGDFGGFGGSKDVWQVYGTFNYQWKPSLILSAGYRYMAIKVDKPNVDVDETLKGPLLGLTYVF